MGPGGSVDIARLATGEVVRGSNSGGGKFSHVRPDRSWGSPSFLYDR